MSCNLLTSKDPTETVVVTFDFSPALGAGETLTGITAVTASVILGVDSNPGAILTGSAVVSIDGQAVQQKVQAGLDGVNYSIKAVATTSAGQTLAVTANLPVRTQ